GAAGGKKSEIAPPAGLGKRGRRKAQILKVGPDAVPADSHGPRGSAGGRNDRSPAKTGVHLREIFIALRGGDVFVGVVVVLQPQQFRGVIGNIDGSGTQHTRTGRFVVPAPHVGREPP